MQRQETSVEASLIAPDPKCYSFLGAPRAYDPAFGASSGLDGICDHPTPTTPLSPLQSLPDCEHFKGRYGG